jgi:hypothetical protein
MTPLPPLHWPDLGYAVRFECDPENDCYLSFRVVGLYAMGLTYPLYANNGQPVEDFEAAEEVVRGTVKWDGCVDLWFNAENIHHCGRKCLATLGEMLLRVHDTAKGLLPRADARCFE